MGVPALFRWLSKKYPKIVSPVVEQLPQEIENDDGSKTQIPVDARQPNPNGEEMDNLYLDMNGIVHPCSHPEDRPPPANEEEMMIAVFEYTDRVVKMVRPRKLLMIAVDGVAPRAKMNQQRSRRFRSAQEAAEKDAAAAEFHAQLKSKGVFDADGEAPRAKMNQQRSRRFRSAQEAAEKDAAAAEFHAQLKSKGVFDADGEGDTPKKTWDTNSITPGTPFMDLLALCLRYWVSYKTSTDPAWEKLKCIISDATVPGEGEHKIMNFVRSQRSSQTHDPNTRSTDRNWRHVIYGLDADLIMLGIATHEPHFRVLREDVFANDTKPGHCRKCNQPGHMADQCMGVAKKKPGEEEVEKPLKPFIWLHVGILREYLAIEMSVPNQGFTFELERALDDWVFMCFFVGNDFLPHLPSLEIREDGIDTLIAIWRDNIPVMGGYVTNDGIVDLARAQKILEGLSTQENAIFQRRRQTEVKREAAAKRRENQKAHNNNKRPRISQEFGNGNGYSGYDETVIRRGPRGGMQRGEQAPDIDALPTFAPGQAQTRADPRFASNLTHADIVGGQSALDKANSENRSAAAVIKEKLKNSKKPAEDVKAGLEATLANDDSSGTTARKMEGNAQALGKRTRDMVEDAADEAATDPSTPGRNTPNIEIAGLTNNGTSGKLGGNDTDVMPEDTVKLWEEGYESRYYEQKFHVKPDDVEFRHGVARAYVEGLAWVLLYYFQGCPSWTWYYPYHYAPFAADFVDMEKQVVQFDKGTPFRPYEQLMGVMPATSNHTIPSCFHSLMTDDDSPIKDFYPVDFELDLNGKKFAWQGVALLPFIDEKRLLDAMATKYPMLSADEQRRNAFGEEALIFSTKHPLWHEVAANFYSKKSSGPKLKLDTIISEGLAGKVTKEDSFVPNTELRFPFAGTQNKFTDLEENNSAVVNYHMPSIVGLHKSQLLPGVQFGTPALDYNDVEQTRQQSHRSGRNHGGVRLTQNGGRSDGRSINYAGHHGGYRQQQSYGGNGYGANGGYGAGPGNYGNTGLPPRPPPLAGYPPGPTPHPTGRISYREDINREDINREDINREDINREDINREDINRVDINKAVIREVATKEVAMVAAMATNKGEEVATSGCGWGTGLIYVARANQKYPHISKHQRKVRDVATSLHHERFSAALLAALPIILQHGDDYGPAGCKFTMAQESPYELHILGDDSRDPDLRALAHFTGQMDSFCRAGTVLDAKTASAYLASLASAHAVPKGVVHAISVPSNPFCEDNFSASYSGGPRSGRAGTTFSRSTQYQVMVSLGIYDGHAGARTSYALKQYLPLLAVDRLMSAGCLDLNYKFKADDALFTNAIKDAFTALDAQILATENIFADPAKGWTFAQRVAAVSQACSGSCALLALYDPENSVLRVANTGDSRAVLGRWDYDTKRYIAKPMSEDHTGFNQKEVERLSREHPGEDIVDPRTGRVHGIAISRAFGDSRWKWTNELSRKAQQLYWGPSPRPDRLIKTPPYLTAEPEIMETRIDDNEHHPDFLIMASDGLWDNISSEDAVTCVQMWLDKFEPSDAARQHLLLVKSPQPQASLQVNLTSDAASDDFEDTYFDEVEGVLK
nr:5'-3' exoribonuclease 2 [Quercus suber]